MPVTPECPIDGSVMSIYNAPTCSVENVVPAPPVAPTATDITLVRETVYGGGAKSACVDGVKVP